MRFVLASHNRGKLSEMQEILEELGVEVVLQSDLGINLEPDENGVDAISGATVTSKAVVNAVNAGLDFYRAAIAP